MVDRSLSKRKRRSDLAQNRESRVEEEDGGKEDDLLGWVSGESGVFSLVLVVCLSFEHPFPLVSSLSLCSAGRALPVWFRRCSAIFAQKIREKPEDLEEQWEKRELPYAKRKARRRRRRRSRTFERPVVEMTLHFQLQETGGDESRRGGGRAAERPVTAGKETERKEETAGRERQLVRMKIGLNTCAAVQVHRCNTPPWD